MPDRAAARGISARWIAVAPPGTEVHNARSVVAAQGFAPRGLVKSKFAFRSANYRNSYIGAPGLLRPTGPHSGLSPSALANRAAATSRLTPPVIKPPPLQPAADSSGPFDA